MKGPPLEFVATLCYPFRDGKILLGKKKRGLGKGLWNGFGGRVEANETVAEAAIREVEEECGLKISISSLTKVALLHFYWPNRPTYHGHVFFSEAWEREPQETEEMYPRWFNAEALPYDEMWPDDREWMPLVLRGQQIEGEVTFLSDGITIAKSTFKQTSF